MPRKCKVCKTPFKPFNSLQAWCSPECGVELASQKLEQKKKRERAQEKRQFYDNDIKTRREAAKRVCHQFIRIRDRDKPCICCGKPLGSNYQAGHFIPSGQNPLTRYDENNIHGQRLDCNYFKGGDSGDYEKNLRARVGNKTVDDLLERKGGTMKRTAQDYKDIEDYYKSKIKHLKQTQ